MSNEESGGDDDRVFDPEFVYDPDLSDSGKLLSDGMLDRLFAPSRDDDSPD